MNLIVQVPVKFKRHGVRRLIIAPKIMDDQTLSASNVPDPVLVAALVRAHRWQRMIEDGLIGNIERLAEKEGISSTFISRTLRLNYLAPDLKCAILTGTHPKTLRLSKGLPIGNLTSQFFANVYMNQLDQFVKHQLHAHYYGRYVDDMILFHEDPTVLNDWYEQIDQFLQDKLLLQLHHKKKHLNLADKGIDFTGFIIKPGRTYLRQATVDHCQQKIRVWERRGSPIDKESLEDLSESVNSYLGMLRQVSGYNVRKATCKRIENLFLLADDACTKIKPITS